jgi:tungstate transport system substrate-binding protein
LVHDPEAEDRFIAEGHGNERRQIAWNDFIVVGSKTDPAHIAGRRDAVAGLSAIAAAQAPFASRGDKIGTDALEKRLWRKANIDPAASSGGTWFRDIGGGMERRSMRPQGRRPIRCPIAARGSASTTKARSPS